MSAPATSPHYSNGSSLSITGGCETNATVNLTGDSTQSATCVGSAFAFTVPKSTDGTYNFTISQTDRAGNSSAGNPTRQWIRDTSAPSAVTVTSQSSPYLSNGNSVVISGVCESNATVSISGSMTSSTTCAGNTYSFTSNYAVDGTYNYSLSQTDRAGNAAGTSSLTWQRDATAPSAPTITNPAASPHTSSGNTLTISGGCETGASVTLAGSGAGTTTCASGAYTLTDTQGSDNTYNYTVTQTDAAGNTSSSASLQWVRSSAIPSTPVVTSPATTPYYSNGSTLTISGTCTSGFTVELSGDGSGSTTCTVGNTFSLSVVKSTDATYSINVRQKSLSHVYSAATTVTWIRDTSLPSAPTVTSPAASPTYTNGSALTVSGACETGATVQLNGASTQTTNCAASSYSFSVPKTVDGTYNMSVSQTDVAGNLSASTALTWVRDTLAPSVPTLVTPGANPFGSGDTNLSISGACEANATVSMSGDATGSQSCSALGSYTFNVTAGADGTYNYSISQTDRATNASSALTFQWIRTTAIPPTPVISVPATSPHYSNGNTITLTASCKTGLSPSVGVVNLSGNVTAGEVTSPAGSLSQNCTTSPVTFVVQKSVDGTYTFNIDQDDPNAGTTSAAATQVWVRDTSVPSVPTITSPSSSPYTAPGNLTINGNCEANATVTLSGDASASQSCGAANTYTFNVVKSTDATYNFSVVQTDRAGNNSSAATLQWVRNSSSLAAPTITTPANNPYLSSDSALTVTGTCTAGYTVTLGGVTSGEVASPAGSLTQTCGAGETFTYVINKSVDGSYALTFKQTYNAVDSATTTFTWTRDTVAPTVTLNTTPPATNLSTSASFAFSANDANATFQCRLAPASYASCTSPVSLTNLANGSQTFYVKATDPAGNVSAEVSYTWTQAATNTMALYHFDSGSPLADSGSAANNLSATGSPTNGTGLFGQAQTLGTNNYLSAADSASLSLGSTTLTVEGWYRLTTAPPNNNNYYTLVSKTGASPNIGWELRLRKGGSKFVLELVASSNGTSTVTATSSGVSMMGTTAQWIYFAMTVQNGVVKFYSSNTASGTATTIAARGTVTLSGVSTLNTEPNGLRIGANATVGASHSLYFAGALDEVRISSIVRNIVTGGSVPSAAFTAD